MVTIKSFAFNLFGTNTYLLWDETLECVIVDPACSNSTEQEVLAGFIKTNNLIPKAQVITHYHIDHIAGIEFVKDTYDIGPTAHSAGSQFWQVHGGISAYGLTVSRVISPDHTVEENDKIRFGQSELEVLYTPGHANGSICLVNHAQKFVIAGDVLFYGSIGRTDLPSGDFDVLIDSIMNKLFVLDDSYIVYPGHGPKTTIGLEKNQNPFLS